MGKKKNKNRQKKESPWKDVPVTTYEELHPKLSRTPEEKAALQIRKKKVNDSLALQRMQRTGPAFKNSPTKKKGKIPKNVQLVPIQRLVEVGTDKDTGEKVFAKVKTNKYRVIHHGQNSGNATKSKGDTGELVPDTPKPDILTPREGSWPDTGPVSENTGAEAGQSVPSVQPDTAK